MANPVFIEDADLWKRMGGQDKLTQLLDPQNTGTWDTGLSLTARTDACNKVIAAAGLQAELTNNVTDFRDNYPHLVTLAAQFAIGLLWDYGTAGQAAPEKVERMVAAAEVELQKIAERRLKQGTVSHNPNAAQQIAAGISLDSDRDLPRITLTNGRWWC